jgi:hypothetical protein
MNLEAIKTISYRFMKEEYPHEAPYFPIAWDIFSEFETTGSQSIMNFKGPRVRLNGESSVMAPRILRAYYILFFTYEEDIYTVNDDETTRSSMVHLLSEKEFTNQFSEKIIDFLFKERASLS